ncbi:type VII secretion integral membrane protein EccD [Streptomyces sioyaensis]|uniref:type VII secretion integral membrane protein EccD n=1 Tax=Streptomyces sioyaensis TaxID=67364 RepID=UPI00364AB012
MVSSAAVRQGAALSRVTLVGERRRVDLVLPAQEPVGVLLPDVLRLLGDRVGEGPQLRRLVTSDGAVLAQDDSLASAGVPDGAVLRLVREQETPAAPVVHDVTDETADDLDLRVWRWGERSRAWTTGVASGLLALVAAVYAATWYGPQQSAVGLGAGALVATGAGAVAGRLGRRHLGTALLLLGALLGTCASWDATANPEARLAALGATVAVVLALLGLCTGLGRGGLVGAASVVLAAAGWELALALTTPGRAGVALGAVSVLALGYLPRLALMSAGLTRLDDQRSSGVQVGKHRVMTALSATHRGLALATVTAAVSAGTGGVLAVAADGMWPVIAAVLLAVVLFSRARAYPLAVEVVALLLATLAVLVRLLLLWAEVEGSPAAPLTALCVCAALPLTALAVRPAEHVRVRLRRSMNLIESVGVVALIPVAIGAFGVYDRLLHTF